MSRVVAAVLSLLAAALLAAAPAHARERVPIVFVHGNTGSAQQFETNAMRFTSNGYRHGDQVLGDILMRGFLHTIGEIDARPQAIILFNSGVKLACEGSAMVDDLRELEDGGVQILACGTCLNHFELQSKLGAGQVSNMYDIAETMLGAGRVVNL